jgi:PBSX family phage terminase large subunit
MKMIFKWTDKQKDALKILGSEAKHVMLFGGSRSGKTFLLVSSVFIRALKAPNTRHLIARFTLNSAKQSLWNGTIPDVLKLRFGGLVSVKENKDLWSLTLPNGSSIWIGGLDDKERVEKILGNEYSTVYFNECSQIPYSSVTTALTRLSENKGLVTKAYYDMNPSNVFHWTYKLFVENVTPYGGKPIPDPENYASLLMNPKDNQKNLPSDYIEKFLENLPENQRKRFLLGEFQNEDEGAVYRIEIEQARKDQRFGDFPYNPSYMVHTAWDIGVGKGQDSNRTAIWFFQYINGKIYIIDFYMDQGIGFMDYLSVLKSKPYKYASHIGPHDIKNTDWSNGKTRWDVAYENGVRFTVAPKNGIEEGIESVRRMFPLFHFDREGCKDGISAIVSYHYEFKEKRGVHAAIPVHDWASDPADALRYLATGFEGSDEMKTKSVYNTKQFYHNAYNQNNWMC